MITAFVYILTAATLGGGIGTIVLSCAHRQAMAEKMFAYTWVPALLLFIANWWMAEAPPFGNMRHVLSFFPLVMVPVAVYVRRYRELSLSGWLAGAAALALVGALCMPMQAAWRQMPALQSPWFAPHVTSYVVAYGLVTVAALLAAALPIRRRQEAEDMRAAGVLMQLSFPFMTFGLWSGALWADAAWGGYWSWDIKEVWALITWTLCILYFHLAQRPIFNAWKRPLILLIFVAVVITFFVVNLLPNIESLHSYAQ